MDTGAEHPKTYEFIRQVVKHFEIDLVCIRSVMTTEVGVGAKFKEISIRIVEIE
jgi:3'-phosphoadenosine 5'-phosphosulfate sulfotransferase (PAPS reductase)/FAD synthetase